MIYKGISRTIFLAFIILGLVTFISIFISCSKKPKEEVPSPQIVHYIRIAPDLSNRLDSKLYPLQMNDTMVFKKFVDFVYDKMVFGSQVNIGLFDYYRIDFINPKQLHDLSLRDHSSFSNLKLEIDLSKFCDKDLDRNAYLGGTKGAKSPFLTDLNRFRYCFNYIEDNFINSGYTSDVYSYIKNIKAMDSIVGCPAANINTKVRNSVLLMTDGYIETSIDSSIHNSEDLSVFKIYAFRHDFEINGNGKSLIDHLRSSNFRITPVNNSSLKNIHFLICQLYDRGDTRGGNGQNISDFEVIEAFWKVWLEESGVPPDQITILKHDRFSTDVDIENEFMKFFPPQ